MPFFRNKFPETRGDGGCLWGRTPQTPPILICWVEIYFEHAIALPPFLSLLLGIKEWSRIERPLSFYSSFSAKGARQDQHRRCQPSYDNTLPNARATNEK